MAQTARTIPVRQNREKRMTLAAHFEELRWTLIRCLCAVILCAVPCGICWRRIFGWIAVWPLRLSNPAPQLIFTAPTDAVFFIFEIALTGGVVIASPFLFLQIWRFVSPGLYKKEIAVLIPAVTASVFCFIGGIAFCYFSLPLFLRFLVGFAEGLMDPLFRVNEYFGFLLKMCLVFGLSFELPVVMFALSKMGIVDHRFLRSHFRHAIVAIFTVGAVLTPTLDALSLLFFSLPLVALYGVSIFISLFTGKRKQIHEQKTGT